MKDKQLAEFSLEDGTKFLVEVEEPESSVIQRVALPTGQIVAKANQSFEQSLETVKPVAASIVNKLKELSADEVEVKFGLKLTADAGAVFTTIGGEVNYEITLKWNQNKSPKDPFA
jgi:Trypsin-co-occurring domain 1